jgi:hypothetical protein
MNMKKIALFLVLLPSLAFAQVADLSPAVSITVPTSNKIALVSRHEDFINKTMTVFYRWLDSTGKPIYVAGSAGRFDLKWTCSDDAEAVPAKTCFSDIYGFTIRAQDVGNTLGKGTRALVINKMKQEIPELAGVTITFGD